MAQVAKFGSYYTALSDKLYHSIEWQYNKVKSDSKKKAEASVLAKIMDTLILNAVNHDLELFHIEAAMKEFSKIRDKAYTPKKYEKVLKSLQIDESDTKGYQLQLGHDFAFKPHEMRDV